MPGSDFVKGQTPLQTAGRFESNVFHPTTRFQRAEIYFDEFQISEKKAKDYLILAELLIEKVKRHESS
jgi:hypothetical protein